ncbi:ion channel [Bradyrhizobium sp. JYMT SZCCT0180]|uniref:ion channel n=1 Tax=Bradyrhizobium sp. JYMT SZCCT0180 TaxID=2807666 RepID=UPI0032DEF638
MLRQFLASIAVSAGNIAIHAIVMAAVLWVARIAEERTTSRPSLRLVGVMIATVSVLMVAHIAEVTVWALTYRIVGAAPPGTDFIYFAFVNYTTLGYGDVTPVETLAFTRANDGDERRAAVRLVDRRHFRGAAGSSDGPDRRKQEKPILMTQETASQS